MAKKGGSFKAGGRREKMDLVAKALKKGIARKDIIDALANKYKGMSPAYAATIIQLTREELGMTGKRATKKSGKAKAKAAKKGAKKVAPAPEKGNKEKKSKKDAFANW